MVPDPWVANRQTPTQGRITVISGGNEKSLDIPADRTSYAYEADVVAAAIETGKLEGETPAMSHADTLGNLGVLDAWRDGAGLVYDGE